MSMGRRSLVAFLYLGPSALLLASVFLFPVGDLAWLSVHDAHTAGGVKGFVGWAHYRELLGPEFLHVLRITAIWVSISTLLSVAVGLAGALLLNRDLPCRGTLRALAFLPWAVPHAMVGVLWRWLAHPQYGLLNRTLLILGLITDPIGFLSVKYAMATAIAMRVWKGAPFAILAILAGLQAIPPERYEAAAVDGAGSWDQFRAITLPGIRGVLVTTSLILAIWAVTTFDMLWVLTEGGPLGATEILPIAIYRLAFTAYDAGRGAAMAVVGLGITGGLAMVYYHFSKERVS